MQATYSLRKTLQDGVFKRLWIGLSLSRIGDELGILALVWLILQITGSGTIVGLALFSFQLSATVAGPVAGQLLDAYQPRLVMGIDNIVRAGIIMMIPVLFWLGILEIWHIFVLALLFGAFSPATEIGVSIIVPIVVDDDKLEGANTLLSMVWEVALLAGPVLAGVLIDLWDGATVLMLDGLTFLVMAAVTLSLPVIARKKEEEKTAVAKPTRKKRFLGFGTFWQMKRVRFVTFLTLALLFAQGYQAVALAQYSQITLNRDAAGYGILLSSFGVGSLAGLFLFNHYIASQRQRPGILLASMCLLFGVFALPLLLVTNLYLAAGFLAVAGLLSAPFFVVQRSLLQRLIPEHQRGTVFGVIGSLGIAGYPLGGAVGGFLLDVLSPPVVIAISCLLCIVMGMSGLISPLLRHTTPESAP